MIPSDTRVFIMIEAIDFRAGINRLVATSEEVFRRDPKGKFLFVFRNKKRTCIKFLFYHQNGFLLGHKRLSAGRLKWWPECSQEAERLDTKDLDWLLRGESLEKINLEREGRKVGQRDSYRRPQFGSAYGYSVQSGVW